MDLEQALEEIGSESKANELGVVGEDFFFVYSYSHATLVDHGGVLVNHFPVCRPLAGSVAAPSPPNPPPIHPPFSRFHRGLNPGSRG